MHQQPGWLYVGDGWLRYRGTEGWTEHYLLAESVRGFDWPPAAPTSAVTTVSDHADETDAATARARAARLRGLLRARGRHTGRHRATV